MTQRLSISTSQVTNVTIAAEQLCHYITDDELSRLGDLKKDPIMEIFLLTMGGAIGSLVPGLQALFKLGASTPSYNWADLVSLMLAVGCLAVAAITGILWRNQSKTQGSLVSDIRTRPRVPVSG